MSELTSKCRRKVCQAESGGLRDLFCGEDHIFNGPTAAAAIGSVNVPVCAADVLVGRVAKAAGDAVDRGGVAFEFEERADGCFIQVQVKTVQAETGAVLFVAEGGLETQCGEGGGPVARVVGGDYFPFGSFFVTGRLFRCAELGQRRFRGEDCAADAAAVDASGSWRCEFGADAEQSAAEAEVGVRSVVERVGFKDAAVVDGA